MGLLIHSVALFVGYWLSSICEWILHRWCMHATLTKNIPTRIFKKIHKDHLIHHIDSNYDMTQKQKTTVDIYKENNINNWNPNDVHLWLRNIQNGSFKEYCHIFTENAIYGSDLHRINDEHLKGFGIKRYFHRIDILSEIENVINSGQYKKNQVELFKGLYFEWSVSITLCISFLFGSILFNFICFNVLPYFDVIIYGQIFAVYITVIWNFIHPTQHLQPPLSLWNGLDVFPRYQWIQNTAIYNWLWANHVFHHLCKGRDAGNYNVTLPGADWLFGTYRTECKGFIVNSKSKKIWKFAHSEFKLVQKDQNLLNASWDFLYQICVIYFSFILVPFLIFLFYKIFILE